MIDGKPLDGQYTQHGTSARHLVLKYMVALNVCAPPCAEAYGVHVVHVRETTCLHTHISVAACANVSLALTVVCTNGSSSRPTSCTPGSYLAPNGTCVACDGVANATAVACTTGGDSEATACAVGTYLASGACLRMCTTASRVYVTEISDEFLM
jgi:hypothetical protein